jgi:hypothetical protein
MSSCQMCRRSTNDVTWTAGQMGMPNLSSSIRMYSGIQRVRFWTSQAGTGPRTSAAEPKTARVHFTKPTPTSSKNTVTTTSGSAGRAATRAPRGAGSPDCIAIAGPGAARPDVGGGGSAGAATSPLGIAEGDVDCVGPGVRRPPGRGPQLRPPPCQPGRLSASAGRARWSESESAAQSRVKFGRKSAGAGSVVGPVRVESVGAAPQEPGPRPRQSGRRWGTDGPATSTSRRTRTRRPGPGDPDYASRGPADRPPRTGWARRPVASRRIGSLTCPVVFRAS